MSSSTQSRSLPEFLKKHKYIKGVHDKISHTRIPNSQLKIYGGAYYIDMNDQAKKDEFLKLYYEWVFTKQKDEYLTETQSLSTDSSSDPNKWGPILVDFDFRYPINITTRQHTENHITDMIDLYFDKIKEFYEIKNLSEVDIYIMEKPNVNIIKKDNVTKDGIHMIISLKMDHSAQMLLREKVVKEIKNVWEDLPITNNWEGVLDEGISKGTTNWQMFGSKKPGHESYSLKYKYKYTFSNDYWSMEKCDISSINMKTALTILSANANSPVCKLNPDIIKELLANITHKPKRKNTKLNLKLVGSNNTLEMDQISSQDELDQAIERMLDEVKPSNYFIKETHEFTMILPKEYYQPGSYNNWIKVGWALKNTCTQLDYRDNRLFLTFLKFSSQSNEFSFADVAGLWDQWCNKFQNNPDGLTKKSIMYWAKQDADPNEYKAIRESTVDFFMNEAIETQAEFDLATVLYQLYKDRFICVSISKNIWYEFRDHRWVENDSGNNLRMAISKDLHSVFVQKLVNLMDDMSSYQHDDPRWAKCQATAHKLASINLKLKKTTDKNNIMRESKELFYDENFLDEQDNKVHLLGFQNGIYDFKEGKFRPGRPEDYVVKSTKIDYVPIDKIKKKYINEITQFMEELFPVKELREYMWQHLASTLIGTNENQTFNIYNGKGRNGKSVLVSLMSKVLGEYKGTVPITLITQKRNSIGSTSSEVVALKGTRYAVMQEPSKGDRINEGIMKEITGGDPIQGRALFKDSITFIPQFKLVVCTNTLFEIKSNDEGTWRRIRVVEFQSKFTEDPVDDDPDEPYQFKVDKKLDEKFGEWKTAMMSMLIELANKSKGNVTDCSMVLSKSKEYRNNQDFLAEFVKEKVVEASEGKIKKQEVYNEFKEWYTLQHGRNVPKGKDLFQYLDKKFGKYKNGWFGVEILYEHEDEEF